MKASEITEQGFYWYFDGKEWTVVHATLNYPGDRIVFWFPGDECESEMKYLDGELFGPLKPPQ